MSKYRNRTAFPEQIENRTSYLVGQLRSPACRRLFSNLDPRVSNLPPEMSEPPTKRTPYEVWERILFYAISVDTSHVLEVTCTPSTYLAFKRTCGDGDSTAYRHEYRIAERFRRSLRLVCRAWNEFAERWDTRERWMRVSALRDEVSDERWRGVQRLEITSNGGMGPWEGEYMSHGPEGFVGVLFNWKMLGVGGGFGMRLRRLEMLSVTHATFDLVFKALCEASSVLRELSSLGIAVPSANRKGSGKEDGTHFRRLSKFFPELVHLTLKACFETGTDTDDVEEDTVDDGMPGESQYDTLSLRNLEVLFLFPSTRRFRLSTWSLPSLKHFHVRPVSTVWNSSIFPFLERHASTIETLDLDDEVDASGNFVPTSSSTYDARTINFWDIFPRLTLLRCRVTRGRFETYPRERHALECFVNTEGVFEPEDLIRVLGPWVEEDGVKRLGSLVLFGSYLSRGVYKSDRGPVRSLLQQCQWNGIRLVNPAGRPWIDPL